MNSAKRLILQNSFWLLLEKIIVMGGSLVLSVLFAQLLGPEDFGRFNYLLSFAALFAPIFALGMTNVLLREFARQPTRVDDILQTCLRARFIAGVTVTAMTILILYLVFGNNWKFQLLSMLLLANVFNALEVFSRWFAHKSMNKQVVLWRVINFVLFFVVKLAAVFYFQSFIILVLVVVAEVLSRNLGYRLLYQRYKESDDTGHYDKALFSDIFAQTRFLIFSGLASVIYLKIDILMLESMAGAEQVGIYSVAAKLSEVWYVLPQIVITAMFPKLLEIAKTSNRRYLTILQRGFDLLFISALVLSLGIYFISPALIDLLFGERYHASAAILQLHIFASLFIFMRALLSQWLVSEKFAQFSLFSQLSGALCNIALNLWLIPKYGAWGAAVATVISYAVSSYFCLLFHARTRAIAWMMTKAMGFAFRLPSIVTTRL